MANPKGNPQTLKPYKPKWRSGKTQTIRVPIAIANQILDAARLIDKGETLVTEKEVQKLSLNQSKQLNTVTSDREQLQAVFEEIIDLPSNRGGQIKIVVSDLAKLLGFEMEKTSKGWKITDTSEL